LRLKKRCYKANQELVETVSQTRVFDTFFQYLMAPNLPLGTWTDACRPIATETETVDDVQNTMERKYSQSVHTIIQLFSIDS